MRHSLKIFLFTFILLSLSQFKIFAQTASITLTANGNDPEDGTVARFSCVQVSGPNTANVGVPVSSDGRNATCNITNLIVGTYVFKWTATDKLGVVSTQNRLLQTVNVLPINQAPIINAGADTTIRIPGVVGMNLDNEKLKMLNSYSMQDAWVTKDYVVSKGGHYSVRVSKAEPE